MPRSRDSKSCEPCAKDRLAPGAYSPASGARRSEEHTSELQSLMRISYAVFCLKKKKIQNKTHKYIKLTKQTNTNQRADNHNKTNRTTYETNINIINNTIH